MDPTDITAPSVLKPLKRANVDAEADAAWAAAGFGESVGDPDGFGHGLGPSQPEQSAFGV